MKIKKIISCLISAVLFMLYASTGTHAEADNYEIVKTDFDVYVEVFGSAPESDVLWYATDFIFWANVNDGKTYGSGYIPVLWVGLEYSLCAYVTEQIRLPVTPSYYDLNSTIPATEGVFVDSRYPGYIDLYNIYNQTPSVFPDISSRSNFCNLQVVWNTQPGYNVGDQVVCMCVDCDYMIWVGNNLPESATKGYISQLESEISRLSELNYKLTNQIKALGGGIGESTVGDIDGDGDISVEDAQLLLMYYTESKVAQLTGKPIKEWYAEKYGSK